MLLGEFLFTYGLITNRAGLGTMFATLCCPVHSWSLSLPTTVVFTVRSTDVLKASSGLACAENSSGLEEQASAHIPIPPSCGHSLPLALTKPSLFLSLSQEVTATGKATHLQRFLARMSHILGQAIKSLPYTQTMEPLESLPMIHSLDKHGVHNVREWGSCMYSRTTAL